MNYSLAAVLSVLTTSLWRSITLSDWPKEKRREHIEKYIAMGISPPAQISAHTSSFWRNATARVSRRGNWHESEMLLLDEPLSAAGTP